MAWANRALFVAGAHARTAKARVRRAEATVGDKVAIGIAFREMKRRAALLGMTVDHIVPLAGCRMCGSRGLHEPDNWQMISGADNASKGNRCEAVVLQPSP